MLFKLHKEIWAKFSQQQDMLVILQWVFFRLCCHVPVLVPFLFVYNFIFLTAFNQTHTVKSSGLAHFRKTHGVWTNWFGQLVNSSFNVREPLWVLHKCVYFFYYKCVYFQVSCVILIAYNDVDMSFMSSEGFLPSVCSNVYYKSF